MSYKNIYIYLGDEGEPLWKIIEGRIGKSHCHTTNPVGSANMRQLLTTTTYSLWMRYVHG